MAGLTFQVHLRSKSSDKITDKELDEAVGVCTRAYMGELASNSMVGGDNADLKGQIFRAMMRAGELDGEVYFAINNSSNQVVGVAVWFPPGKLLFDTKEQRALGFDDFMDQLSIETKKFWAESYAPVVEKFLADEKILGPEAISFQDFEEQTLISIYRERKKRIASTLLKTVHDKFAESDTRPLFAHCAANELTAGFYKSCGYIEKGRMVMNAPTGAYPVISLTK
ncbi:hypothetical protein DFH06DRAFT_1366923 [Mycena polygramma]|nr:hypothetical protein DFH06DRAFT_1366923 [Mycena polygramma]